MSLCLFHFWRKALPSNIFCLGTFRFPSAIWIYQPTLCWPVRFVLKSRWQALLKLPYMWFASSAAFRIYSLSLVFDGLSIIYLGVVMFILHQLENFDFSAAGYLYLPPYLEIFQLLFLWLSFLPLFLYLFQFLLSEFRSIDAVPSICKISSFLFILLFSLFPWIYIFR